MEQLEYNLLFRLVCRPEYGRAGLGTDSVQQEPGSFDGRRTSPHKFFDQILGQAEAANLTSDEHFSAGRDADRSMGKPSKSFSAEGS